MAETVKTLRTCTKCRKDMEVSSNYYKTKEGEYLDKCKKCFTMHINVREASTVLPLLEIIDVPFIEREWTTIVDKHGNNPKTTSTAIFGRYMAKMKLTQFSKYSFKDTDKFLEDQRIRELKDKAEKFDRINKYRDAKASGEIPEDLASLDLSVLSDQEAMQLIDISKEERFSDDLVLDHVLNEESLTSEDKFYLFTKWGKTYTINECIKLEKLHNEMIDSYDIRTASHKDYLLKICRVSLKIDQSLECNDIDGFHKMSRVYDILMKSAKFTAAQSKGESDDYTDAIGVLVAMCEESGFIPKYHSERPDVVDITLSDMNKYMSNLIMNEMNLGNMIDIYMQKMVMEQTKEEDEMEEEEDIVIIKENEEEDLTAKDYEDYSDMLDSEAEFDEEALRKSGESL